MDAQKNVHRSLGFTLIELMIVVAIIALLIAILLPSLARARQQAMQVACAANLNAIHKGTFYYTEDPLNGNGYLPQLGVRIQSDGAAIPRAATGRPVVGDEWSLVQKGNDTRS